ncbi:MAG: hypothetical protein VKQ33_09925 [Candidatus Sericytochromatia bacterium]|nr:hypothetical protein [Candidatus Sericytochromatia bacterium]
MWHDNGFEAFDAHVALHDRSQFEVQFTYGISPEHLTHGQACEHYRVEAYYFFPSNMGITALNLPREEFYRNVHAYYRFKTPEIAEEALLDPLNRQSPLNALSFLLKRLSMGLPLEAAAAGAEARLFGTVLSQAMRQRLRAVEQQLTRARAQQEAGPWRELEGLTGEMVHGIAGALEKYRGLLADYRSLEAHVPATVLQTLRHVDEFLTYRFDHTLAALNFGLTASWEAPIRLDAAAALVQHTAEGELEHRRREGYVHLSPGDEQALSLYTYRSGALKKLVEQVLFLDVRTVQQTNRWRNLAAMLGAMFAAIFAGYTDRSVTLPLYQHSLWIALTLFAIFYVAKDRMKEVLREYVWEHVSHYFPDNRLTIQDPSTGSEVGRCLEKVRFMAKDAVPGDALGARNFSHVVDLDSERKETVVLYRNDLKLYAREILSEHQRRTHIKHIVRFNVETLLARLDNPTSQVQFYDAESQLFCRLRAPKVYHLNVVFRLTRREGGRRMQAPLLRRIRVVLDKNGLRRIDLVPLEAPTGQPTAVGRSLVKTEEPRVQEDPLC